MHVLLIIFLKGLCKHGRQTLTYFSKVEDETSEAMKLAVKDAINGKNQILRE